MLPWPLIYLRVSYRMAFEIDGKSPRESWNDFDFLTFACEEKPAGVDYAQNRGLKFIADYKYMVHNNLHGHESEKWE